MLRALDDIIRWISGRSISGTLPGAILGWLSTYLVLGLPEAAWVTAMSYTFGNWLIAVVVTSSFVVSYTYLDDFRYALAVAVFVQLGILVYRILVKLRANEN
jgi:hypothetical protein